MMNHFNRQLWLFFILLNTLILVITCKDFSLTFDTYIKVFNKPYKSNSSEYWARFNNFQESLKRIEKLNINASSHDGNIKYGITKFSDLSSDEFHTKVLKHVDGVNSRQRKISLNRLKTSIFHSNFLSKTSSKNLPLKVDWREQHAVTPVKNQQNCGACWAFSIVETIESINKIKRGELKELSVQQVIDCAVEGEFGCNGGNTCEVLEWMNATNFNLTTEEIYPLKDVLGKCHRVKSSYNIQIAENFTCLPYVNKEELMARLIAFHGPIVAAVDATTWQDYLGGIIQYHCDKRLNHAVEIVGYDFTGKVPYYIVRNSWGTDYGLDGYLHIASGKNLCGIAEYVSVIDIK